MPPEQAFYSSIWEFERHFRKCKKYFIFKFFEVQCNMKRAGLLAKVFGPLILTWFFIHVPIRNHYYLSNISKLWLSGIHLRSVFVCIISKCWNFFSSAKKWGFWGFFFQGWGSGGQDNWQLNDKQTDQYTPPGWRWSSLGDSQWHTALYVGPGTEYSWYRTSHHWNSWGRTAGKLWKQAQSSINILL